MQLFLSELVWREKKTEREKLLSKWKFDITKDKLEYFPDYLQKINFDIVQASDLIGFMLKYRCVLCNTYMADTCTIT